MTIALETVQELDAQGRKLRTVEFTKHTAEQVLSLVRSSDELRDQWVDGKRREAIVQALEEKGIALEHLYLVTSGEESDAFDLLCHLAFDAPLLTRKQRAEAAKRRVQDEFQTFGKTALGILEDLLERYVETDIGEVTNTKVFKLLPTTKHLNTLEVANVFGGVPQLQAALEKFQAILYA